MPDIRTEPHLPTRPPITVRSTEGSTFYVQFDERRNPTRPWHLIGVPVHDIADEWCGSLDQAMERIGNYITRTEY